MRDDERKMMVEMTWEEFKKWEEFKNNGFKGKEADLFYLFDSIRERRSHYARITGGNSDTIVTYVFDSKTSRQLQITISEEYINGKSIK